MKKIFCALSFLACIQFNSFGQSTDTLNVMAYNLLNFPEVSSTRVDTLKGILQYAKPDILMVCELSSAAGGDDILFNALNVDGQTNYASANFSNGPDSDNLLFYRSDKLGLKEQNVISTDLRDINEYVLYYKTVDIATAIDTIFFYVYICHLKASTGFEAERNAEAQALKNYIASRSNRENILIGGDFNFYGSDIEPAWNTILSGSGVTIVDPINSPGHWNSNSAFANIHTQSTRTTSFGGGATGGMDDRFDFIFMSPDLVNYGNMAKYVPGTYKALGQDGQHYNDALIDAPLNTSVPYPVLLNLYHMSDHLPVIMKISVSKFSVTIPEELKGVETYYNAQLQQIIFKTENNNSPKGKANISDLSGRAIKYYDDISNQNFLDVSDLDTGTYILQLIDYNYSWKFVKY